MTDQDFWAKHQKKIEKNFKVVFEAFRGSTVFVEAEAQTGSRYVVVASKIHPAAAERVGGSVLVSVLQPWTAAYPFTEGGGEQHPDYIWEKLGSGRPMDQVHPGDYHAIAKAVNEALEKAEIL